MTRFVNADRQTSYLPPPVEEWPQESHWVRFIVEVVEGLDLSPLANP